ncbi:MAG: formylglycine-generating enzyme family protein, partial [Pirellulales bacterium]|nr:formylglycine-generating enzyme family protein [Pirellulales bacterium]
MRHENDEDKLMKHGWWCLILGLLGTASEAQSPALPAGVVKEKPGKGRAVQVGDHYMVPYVTRIPGTDVTFEMIPVPGGTYTMGSPENEEDRNDDEGPQVRVNVAPMWVAKYEVRWDAYKEFMRLYEVFTDFEAKGIRKVEPSDRLTYQNRIDTITAPTPLYQPDHTWEWGDDDDQPAVTMTQYSAMQFTKWLSAITGQQFRLPTEAEWEYACRGGTTTAYYWGDDVDDADAYAWYFGNAKKGQLPGGKKTPNPFGLYDMHGNVVEWTVNAYTEDGYAWLVDQQPVDAVMAVKWPETATHCVVRGGTWESYVEEIRSAARLVSDDELWKDIDPNIPKSPWWFTDDPVRGIGFRVFRSYQPLEDETIRKFWDHIAADA